MVRTSRIAVNEDELNALKEAKKALFGESSEEIPHGIAIRMLANERVETEE